MLGDLPGKRGRRFDAPCLGVVEKENGSNRPAIRSKDGSEFLARLLLEGQSLALLPDFVEVAAGYPKAVVRSINSHLVDLHAAIVVGDGFF